MHTHTDNIALRVETDNNATLKWITTCHVLILDLCERGVDSNYSHQHNLWSREVNKYGNGKKITNALPLTIPVHPPSSHTRIAKEKKTVFPHPEVGLTDHRTKDRCLLNWTNGPFTRSCQNKCNPLPCFTVVYFLKNPWENVVKEVHRHKRPHYSNLSVNEQK